MRQVVEGDIPLPIGFRRYGREAGLRALAPTDLRADGLMGIKLYVHKAHNLVLKTILVSTVAEANMPGRY